MNPATAVRCISTVLLLTFAGAVPAAEYPPPVDGDFIARDFAFATGERLSELKLHYRTIGTPQRDATGVVRNAVLILHGTGGTGAGFLSQTFAGQLFGAGQAPDATPYVLVLAGGFGAATSRKPS